MVQYVFFGNVRFCHYHGSHFGLLLRFRVSALIEWKRFQAIPAFLRDFALSTDFQYILPCHWPIFAWVSPSSGVIGPHLIGAILAVSPACHCLDSISMRYV